MNGLNPLNYLNKANTSAHPQLSFEAFMDRQLSVVHKNKKLYPYTVDNPFDSSLRQAKIRIFGKSTKDLLTREALADHGWAKQVKLTATVFDPNASTKTGILR